MVAEVAVLSLPGKERVVLQDPMTEVDAAFADAGKWLVCLPSLRIIAEDKRTVTYARASHTLRIFDSNTGQRIREINAQKP